jgi:hypothetical protein
VEGKLRKLTAVRPSQRLGVPELDSARRAAVPVDTGPIMPEKCCFSVKLIDKPG